jgi:hypothetical protein
VAQLGANAHGEVLEPGRVPDCYLGLRLDPPAAEAPEVLMVAPASLLHPAVPQPNGTVLYELVTGHPDRVPHELVFLVHDGSAIRSIMPGPKHADKRFRAQLPAVVPGPSADAAVSATAPAARHRTGLA